MAENGNDDQVPQDNQAPGNPGQQAQQAAQAVFNNVNHTQTIAAPLHFAGNDPPTANELKPREFLRQLEIRMLGNRLQRDEDKLAFTLNTLQGDAHEWYVALDKRSDFERTFAYLKKLFCHKYRVPGQLPQEYDIGLISKQRIEEDPTQYMSRITNSV